MINKNALKILFIQILLIITLVLYLPYKAYGAPIFLFWPIIWSIVIVTIWGILKLPKKYKITLLILLEVCLSLILIVSVPNIFQMDRDTYFESQYASTIIEEGMWDPTLGVGFAEDYYGYNPVLHFMLALSSLTTGVITYALSKYFYFAFLRVMLVLLVFLLISMLFKKDKQGMAYLATFIFIASSGMAFIEISRRLIADIFMILALYAILKDRSEPTNKVWNVLFYVFSALVVIGNHSIAYLLLIVLATIWLFGLIAKTKTFKHLFPDEEEPIHDYPNVLFKLIYFFVIIYLWQTFTTTILLQNDFSYIVSVFKLISGGDWMKLIFAPKSVTAAASIYHSYEIIIIYSYQFLFFLLGALGFLLFVISSRKHNFKNNNITNNKNILFCFGIIATIMYIFSLALILTRLPSASYTFLWFFCIPLSIFVAYFLSRINIQLNTKSLIFAILISLLFYTGHLFTGIYTPRITNRALDEDVVLGMDIRSQSSELYYSASWLNKNADKNSKVMGDINVFEIYSGLFGFIVSTDEYRAKQMYAGNLSELNDLLLADNIYIGSNEHTANHTSIDYLVIDDRFFDYLNYLFGKPVEAKKAEKFDKTNFMDKVYTNRKISIYHNTQSKDS